MENRLFYDELVKRYLYLQENKDLILAMCIRRINNDKKLKEDIESYKEMQKRLRLSDKHLLDDIIKSLKNRIGEENFYLCFNVSKGIVDAYEEFLFTDGSIEDTAIYKYVEALKKDELYYDSVQSMIESLNERRSYNQWLKNIPAFTVWKILNYVRERNKDNSVALLALDRYYNIDRTMLTGVNWDSGYTLDGEEKYDDSKLCKYPDMTLISGVSGSYVIFNYMPNAYEVEDDYFAYVSEFDEPVLNGEAKTVFMDKLSKLPNLSSEEKLNIYKSYHDNKKLTLE